MKDFGIVSLDEHEGSATNFPKVADEGDHIEPELMWSSSIQRGRSGEIGKICHSGTNLIP